MNKKVLILTITIIFAIIILFLIFRFSDNRNQEIALNEEENTIDISEVSDEPVTDSCIDEWEEYEKYVAEQSEEANSNISEEDTHYLLKDVLGYIEIYYLDENKEEILYKKTTIPTTYLSQEDIDNLKEGIDVVGIEELNKLLEDFE